jgi:hypothetical protein
MMTRTREGWLNDSSKQGRVLSAFGIDAVTGMTAALLPPGAPEPLIFFCAIAA